jgi:thiamine pyrophosphate-dependent acetolactate synthase large subunit-like protein
MTTPKESLDAAAASHRPGMPAPERPAVNAPETSTDIERPMPTTSQGVWASDVLAQMLRKLGIRYVALTPGASFRGLHDSIVNHLGNGAPQLLLSLHEEHAVAIAHGYAKVAEEPIAAILHSNVGLMHGTMAIFNAWCDRVPVLVLGATGPVDAARRRPWIDWLHTSSDQAALVRNYVKWDNQPASIEAAVEALLRADLYARSAPRAPVYVCFDAALQEQKLDTMSPLPDTRRFQPAAPSVPNPNAIARAAELLRNAASPIILAGRVSRKPWDWARRVALAERLKARVVTDLKLGAAFPTDHPLHLGKPGSFLDEATAAAMRSADVVLSLDWLDLGGAFKQAATLPAQIIQISMDYQLHNGWGMEYQALAPADIHLACEADVGMHALADALGVDAGRSPEDRATAPALGAAPKGAPLDQGALAAALGQGLAGERVCFVRLPLGWSGDTWHFRHPLDFLGADGGAGIGSGPGMLVGAALALKGSGRLAVAVLGDGDFLMSSSAFWTAAHYKIPLLAVIANNRSFHNDEVHQERVAKLRDRPVANKWIGQRIGDPDIDLAAIARAQGLAGFGPVDTPQDLVDATREAVKLAHAGGSVVIDARLSPGYDPTMTAAPKG